MNNIPINKLTMKLVFIVSFSFSINGNSQDLYFPPTTGENWDSITPESINWCQNKIDSLYTLLDSNNTKAFILLKDGKIVLEKYFNTHTKETPWYWASAGKVLTAFMIGIAQQENHLSINDTTSKHLGQGWTNCTAEQEGKITILHQLTMTSGLDDGIDDHFCTLDTCLIYKADPGTRWAYHNGPYTLLDRVIDSATQQSLNLYITQKLLSPTGMTGSFFKVDYNNVFFSKARSMARFGLLILNKGNWDGNQILTDTAYYNQMVNTSQSLNESYGYLWWLNGKSSFMVPQLQFVFDGTINSNAPDDMISALGKNGQFINVIPSKNMVWIRMGDLPGDSNVPFIFNEDIWGILKDIECPPIFIDNIENKFSSISTYPNPVNNLLNIKSNMEITKVEILNTLGQTLISKNTESFYVNMQLEEFIEGIYFVKAELLNGEIICRKIIKN